MLPVLMVSLLFFAVGTIVLASGIFTLQSNSKALVNKVFFILTVSITFWSYGMAMSTIAADVATCEIYRRISAIGWGTVYAILLHLILIITGKSSSLKKWWFYLCLYLPALFSVLAFAVPNGIIPLPYDLRQTDFGWINVPLNNIWDCIFYAYYISYNIIGLILLYRWGKKSSDIITKKKSRIMILSLLLAGLFGTITDIVLSSIFSELPQMAPILVLIPALSIYHILQKDSLSISESIDKKTSYIILFSSILTYIILTALQSYFSNDGYSKGPAAFDQSIIRGIIVQIQMFLSIYMVLKENRPGYISAVILNFISLISAITYIIRYESSESLPGIISYTGVLVIITLIKAYKEKNDAYIKKINTQTVRENFYSSVFRQAPVGIAILSDTEYTKSKEFDDLNINPSYIKILGRSKDELENIHWPQITHPDDLASDLESFEQFKKGNIDYYSREKRYIKPDGSNVWVDMLISRFANPDENPGDHICIITDITERKKIEATLKYNNEHVLLTGLHNRGVLEKTLQSDVSLPSSNKRALVCINLFAMHTLSVRYGYYYNQTMIKNIADSLKAFCNDNYLLFDTNEYRFVYYVKGYEDDKELTDFYEKLSAAVSSFLYVHGIKYTIGVLKINKTIEQDTGGLLKKVMDTTEMSADSNRSCCSVLFYSPELDIKINRENDISQEIREIVEGIKPDRFYLQYQPILDIASNSICGFEALARLNSEKYGLVAPMEFIQIAEKTNMIVPFGESIINKALRFSNKLKENGHDTMSVSINISMIQILEKGFTNMLLGMIADMHVNPENIGIELTESVFATESTEINTVIDALKTAGIKVLIDDFGTGYSSFARESELNIDCLKIDKSFIDKLMQMNPEEALTGDIISMAHKLGHGVVAEGVEHEKQFNYLRDHSCDKMQGYLISKPLDEDAALAYLLEVIKTGRTSHYY